MLDTNFDRKAAAYFAVEGMEGTDSDFAVGDSHMTRAVVAHEDNVIVKAGGRLDVREIAGQLSITLETVRFHLKPVLAKTGTRRQPELMRLMLLLPGLQGSCAHCKLLLKLVHPSLLSPFSLCIILSVHLAADVVILLQNGGEMLHLTHGFTGDIGRHGLIACFIVLPDKEVEELRGRLDTEIASFMEEKGYGLLNKPVPREAHWSKSRR